MIDPLHLVFDSPEKTRMLIQMLKDRGVKFGIDTDTLTHQELVRCVVEIEKHLKACENPQ
jgi:hypothetical protein